VSANAGEVAKLVWLPAGLAGIGLEQVACVDGSVICALTFDKVRIPRTNELTSGDAARSAVQIANDTARIAQGAELLGIVRRTFAITVEHLKTRQQFGKPIGSFQALQHRAVDGYVQLELSAASLSEALDAAEDSSGNFSAAASRVKARCAHAAMMVTRMAIQFHGAMGYTDECDVSLYFKRTLHLSGWLGNAASNRKRYFAWQSRPAVVEAVSTVNEFPRDADWEKMPEAEFREMVRSFFVQKFPQHLRNVPRRVHWHEIKEWYITLSLQGWVAPAWPKKFGGMGLPPDKLLAYIEEQEQYGVARAPDMGVVMIGPLLIQRGSDEQRTKFLPKILSGENVWCQGYSEPGAGSDLASLRTEAIIDGDHFVVTGQKIWTTLAQDATHMFALVRTDKTAKKQAGISFILIDLATPGITIRPIKDIGGDAEFCEVFFDQVRVPCENLVGELNQGWTIAKALLGFERIFLGSPKQSRYALGQLTALADTRKLFDSEAFVARYVELQLDVADLSAAYTYFAEFVKRSEPLPTSVSMLKIWAAETYQRISTMIVEAADDHGGSGLTSDFGNGSINVPALMFSCLAATIYGGSSEIQRNIIAKNVLGLPD
jgi:alkylation response protein AidB-like acyl-CoA dehydrogenase